MTEREKVVRARVVTFLREHHIKQDAHEGVRLDGLRMSDKLDEELRAELGAGRTDPGRAELALLVALERLVFECMGRR